MFECQRSSVSVYHLCIRPAATKRRRVREVTALEQQESHFIRRTQRVERYHIRQSDERFALVGRIQVKQVSLA